MKNGNEKKKISRHLYIILYELCYSGSQLISIILNKNIKKNCSDGGEENLRARQVSIQQLLHSQNLELVSNNLITFQKIKVKIIEQF